MYQNKLVNETSLYLQQHAQNPVSWVPWSDQAFELASQENKLVLVSIGYSSCHWCHVMEKECFEDQEVAEIMNRYFISIKVDREERPDIDLIYMNAIQLMNQRGGWPLNCVTLPDGRPIFGGTYLPKPQWMNVLKSLVKVFEEEPIRVAEFAEKVMLGLAQTQLVNIPQKQSEGIKTILKNSMENWSKRWDLKYGGNIGAPKFPLPSNQLFLLRYADFVGDQKINDFVELTIYNIMRGGIYDQIGGGFCRYSTDDEWHIPHFEKMLYDNAQLLALYAEAFGKLNDSEILNTIKQTISWLKREMKLTSGGYCASIDADSEGKEGIFYCWKEEDLDFLADREQKLVKERYTIHENFLWEDNGYVLKRQISHNEFMKVNDISAKDLEKMNSKLFERREKRVHPIKDKKVITSWNAMLAKGYLACYRYLKRESYFQQAQSLIKFLDKNLVNTDSSVRIKRTLDRLEEGFLDDYAFVIDAFIEFYQASGEIVWLNKSMKLTQYVRKYFLDTKSKMYYYAKQNKILSIRTFESQDNVIPSSNAVMCMNLMKLGRYFERPKWIKEALQMTSIIAKDLERYGSGYSFWATNMITQINGFNVVQNTLETVDAKSIYQNTSWLELVVFNTELPVFQNHKSKGVYVCDNHSCSNAIPNLEELKIFLKNKNHNC